MTLKKIPSFFLLLSFLLVGFGCATQPEPENQEIEKEEILKKEVVEVDIYYKQEGINIFFDVRQVQQSSPFTIIFYVKGSSVSGEGQMRGDKSLHSFKLDLNPGEIMESFSILTKHPKIEVRLRYPFKRTPK